MGDRGGGEERGKREPGFHKMDMVSTFCHNLFRSSFISHVSSHAFLLPLAFPFLFCFYPCRHHYYLTTMSRRRGVIVIEKTKSHLRGSD